MAKQPSDPHVVAADIAARMLNGAEFTYGGLCDLYGKEHERLIYRTIQKLSKAGKIFKRKSGRDGRSYIWRVALDG